MLTTLINPAILEEGLKKGKEEGIKEGLKKGKEDGLKEGKLDDAKNMLMKGLGVSLIVEITGLAEREVLKLKEELENIKPY